jgi:hypothetical protein
MKPQPIGAARLSGGGLQVMGSSLGSYRILACPNLLGNKRHFVDYPNLLMFDKWLLRGSL